VKTPEHFEPCAWKSLPTEGKSTKEQFAFLDHAAACKCAVGVVWDNTDAV